MFSVSNREEEEEEEEKGEEEEEEGGTVELVECWGTWWAVQVSFLQHSQSEREEKIPDSPLSYLCLLSKTEGAGLVSYSISSSSELESASALYRVMFSTYSWSRLPMSHLVFTIFCVAAVLRLDCGHDFIFEPRRLMVNLCGSFPSFLIISGKILRRALMNQLQT